jgi:glucosylceramidase
MHTPKSPILFFSLLAACAVSAPAQRTVDVYVTAQATGQKLAAVAPLTLAPAGPLTEKQQYVFIDATKRFQTVLGIGGALTDASAETYAKLPEAKRREFIRAY